MRKKLLFCSALLLSASLAGCGYNDDNVRETVPALPEKCTSTNECVSGTAAGQCIEGHCLRYCEDKTDCEDGTICESGLCRHIEACPTMTFTKLEDASRYKDAKCLKVFSHTPATSWVDLLTQNIKIDTVSGRNSSTNFTSKNFAFQIPNRALQGGLNYSLVVASALTFIILENMASTQFMQCVMPDDAKNPSKYAVKIEPTRSVSLADDSLLEVCQEISDYDIWKNDFGGICTTENDYYKYMKRFEYSTRISTIDTMETLLQQQSVMEAKQKLLKDKKEEDLTDEERTTLAAIEQELPPVRTQIQNLQKDYISAQNCQNAMITWITLQKVYGVITQATLQSDSSRTSTNHVISWITSFLTNGYVDSLTYLNNDTFTYEDNVYNLKLRPIESESYIDSHGQPQNKPSFKGCQDLINNMSEIQTTVCNDIMAGLTENPMSKILSTADMNLAQCLSDDNTAASLLKNGFTLIDDITEQTNQTTPLPHTLPGIAQTLTLVTALGNAELAKNFQSMRNMVTALGDPTFIWLTQNNIQELNIISNQTEANPFKANDLMLGINYSGQSEDITKAVVNLDVYDTGSVSYDSGIPKLIENPEKLGTNIYNKNKEEFLEAALLSRKPNTNGIYEFYFNPTKNNQDLICGGVTLNITTIDGYVVLNQDQINSMNGTALIVETPK